MEVNRVKLKDKALKKALKKRKKREKVLKKRLKKCKKQAREKQKKSIKKKVKKLKKKLKKLKKDRKKESKKLKKESSHEKTKKDSAEQGKPDTNKEKGQRHSKKKPEVVENGSAIGPSVDMMMASQATAPMTREDWEKQESVLRRVYDQESGRHRLIKGSGEVMEECVSRDRHRAINKAATQADGEFFQVSVKSRASK